MCIYVCVCAYPSYTTEVLLVTLGHVIIFAVSHCSARPRFFHPPQFTHAVRPFHRVSKELLVIITLSRDRWPREFRNYTRFFSFYVSLRKARKLIFHESTSTISNITYIRARSIRKARRWSCYKIMLNDVKLARSLRLRHACLVMFFGIIYYIDSSAHRAYENNNITNVVIYIYIGTPPHLRSPRL